MSVTSEKWQVADLVVDLGRVRVTRGDEEIKLARLSFDLLLALTRAAPNVLSADALMDQVWPGLVVGPDTIAQRVKLLRSALGDNADHPRYVASKRGRGYGLVPMPVRLAEPRAEADTASLEESERRTPVAKPGAAQAQPSRAETGAAAVPEMTSAPVAGGAAMKRRRVALAAWGAVALAAAVLALWLRVPHIAVPPRSTEFATAQVGMATTRADRAVAVLPFRSLSDDPRDAFLAQGLPETVLNRLATVGGLTVIARDSAMLAAMRIQEPRVLGEQLGVGYLVDGSVQRSGERLRVTVRLASTRDSLQIWSQTFDRPLSELFALQDEIAQSVAEALRSRIADLQLPAPRVRPTRNVAAYLAYLRGRTLLGRRTIRDVTAAAAQFEHAVAADSDFSDANVALYDARMQVASLRIEDLADARERNRQLLRQAEQREPDAAAVAYAHAMWDDIDDAAREAWFRKAVERDPADSRGLQAFAEFLRSRGSDQPAMRRKYAFLPPRCMATAAGCPPGEPRRIAEANALLDRAIALDPLAPGPYYERIWTDFDSAGAAVHDQIAALLQRDPEFEPALNDMAKIAWLVHDDVAGAIAYIEKPIASDPENPWPRMIGVALYLDLDDAGAAEQVAAAAPASERASRAVRALFAGDLKSASAAALEDDNYLFGAYESWGVMQALCDGALATGQFGPAQSTLLRRYLGLRLEAPYSVSLVNFRAYVSLARLQLAQGNVDAASDMLRAVIAWIGANPQFGKVHMLRTRAEAHLLMGKREQALADLADSFLKDRDHTEWWYTLRRNPLWTDLRDDPVFEVIEADVNAYVARARADVAVLRERGEIPARQ